MAEAQKRHRRAADQQAPIRLGDPRASPARRAAGRRERWPRPTVRVPTALAVAPKRLRRWRQQGPDTPRKKAPSAGRSRRPDPGPPHPISRSQCRQAWSLASPQSATRFLIRGTTIRRTPISPAPWLVALVLCCSFSNLPFGVLRCALPPIPEHPRCVGAPARLSLPFAL